MADPNVFQQLIRPVKSVVEYGADLDRQEASRLELASKRRQNAIQDMAAQQQTQKQNALQRAAAGWGADTTDDQRIQSLRGNPLTFDAADALETSVLKRNETRSKVAKDDAEAEKIKLANTYMVRDRHLQGLANVTDPQQAAAWINQGVQLGEFSMQQAQQIVQGLQSGQIPLEQWKQRAQQGGMTLQQQAQQRMEELKAAETQRHNKASEANTVRGQDLTASTTIRGQNMTDTRSREANATQRELLIQEKGLKVAELQDKAAERAKAKDAGAAAIRSQIAVIDKALTHPGREASTGLSGTLDPRNYVPGTDATDFRAVLDQIGGAAFLQAFESLRGGGAITEVEGKKATDAIARLNRAQSDGEFEVALKDLRDVMSAGYKRSTGKDYGGAPAASTKPPQIKDEAGYAALPKGAVYIDPNGKTRRKQ